MNNGVPLDENGKEDAPVTGQVLTKDDGGGGSTVNDTLEEVATPTTTSATKHPHEKAMLPPLGCPGSGTEDCSPTWELG